MAILVSLGIFLCVFCAPIDSLSNKFGNYIFGPDTFTYLTPEFNPWKSFRAPGYAIFLYPFLEPHRTQLEKIFREVRKLPTSEVWGPRTRLPEFINAGGMQGVFDNIVLCQKIFLGLSLAFLVYTCSLYFNPVVAGVCILLGLQITPLVNPAFLLTESVAQPLSFLAIGFLLLAFKNEKRHFLFLFLATLSASIMYLVRPSGLCLMGICALTWIYLLWKEHFRHVGKLILVTTGFLPAIVYIVYISITAGYLIFSTHPQASDLQFSSYFLEPEDIENMPTLRSKEYARLYLDASAIWRKENIKRLWPDFDAWPQTRSFAYRYNIAVWPLTSRPERVVLAELAKNPQIGRLSIKDRVRLGRELKAGMLKRHTWDRIKTVYCNILAGLGCYSDFRSSSLQKYGFPFILTCWGVWCFALVICPQVRVCLFLLGATHLLHIFAIAYGNFIAARYINLTETLFVFAAFLALWALLERLWQLCQKIYVDRRKETESAVI